MKQCPNIIELNSYPSRPARGAWIETGSGALQWQAEKSRPARGAWIETRKKGLMHEVERVAPRAGRVD